MHCWVPLTNQPPGIEWEEPRGLNVNLSHSGRFRGLDSAWGPAGQKVSDRQRQMPGPLCPSVQTRSSASIGSKAGELDVSPEAEHLGGRRCCFVEREHWALVRPQSPQPLLGPKGRATREAPGRGRPLEIVMVGRPYGTPPDPVFCFSAEKEI